MKPLIKEMKMNIYYIYQTEVRGYDTYDSAVVIAKNERAARCMHPNPYYHFKDNKLYFTYKDGRVVEDNSDTWVNDPSKVNVQLIGAALPTESPRVVCASFNAG